MSVPSIEDVKAAIDEIARLTNEAESFNDGKVVLIRQQWRRVLSVADFANAILSAPGMSAERLAEIQRETQRAFDEQLCWDETSFTGQEFVELIDEVLRLRAGYFTPNELAVMGSRTPVMDAGEYMLPLAELEAR